MSKFDYFDDDKLYKLIFQEDFSKIVDFLKIYGIDSRDRDGSTFLMSCVTEKKVGFVKKLIDLGVDINAQNNQDFTALHLAIQENNQEILDLLLSKENLKIDLKDQWGNTPLLRLVEEEDVKNIPIIDKLLDKGASLDVKNKSNISPRDSMQEITDEGIVDYSKYLS